MSSDLARARYLADAVATATPARRIVLLYDRLWLDVQRGVEGLASADPAAAGDHVQHAQQIVAELLGSLDTTAWEGAGELASLYTYLLRELMNAIVSPTPGALDTAAGIITGLRDTWKQAEVQLQTGIARAAAAPAARQAAWVG
ncbi:flagellar export chaperone FliS [Rhodococcus sp. X156]|uniref:flagellar export chaperone FliS n=1 Tax=Rhodococcus sp. X156 TaxID=2499145 RepID=UPI0013E36F41|nr:flagellar export chaperone FliS [Rhodococcus sp. X156]